jgi:hypothetical protein
MFGDIGSMRPFSKLPVTNVFKSPANALDPTVDGTYFNLRGQYNRNFVSNFLSSMGLALSPSYLACIIFRDQSVWVCGRSGSYGDRIPSDGVSLPNIIDGVWFSKLSNATYTPVAAGNLQNLTS